MLRLNLSRNQLQFLKDLSKNKDIVIMKPDKGVGVVILDSVDYKRKMFDILNNKQNLNYVVMTFLQREK